MVPKCTPPLLQVRGQFIGHYLSATAFAALHTGGHASIALAQPTAGGARLSMPAGCRAPLQAMHQHFQLRVCRVAGHGQALHQTGNALQLPNVQSS